MTTLTERDWTILKLFARALQYATVLQLAHLFASEKAATKRLKTLERGGFLRRFRILCRWPLPTVEHLLSWHPLEPIPNCHKLAYQASQRWRSIDNVCELVVFTATPLLHSHFSGASGELPPPTGADSHDVYATDVFFYIENERPELARSWRAAFTTKKERQGLIHPDVSFDDDDGQTFGLLEVCGDYPYATRYTKLFESAASRHLPLMFF